MKSTQIWKNTVPRDLPLTMKIRMRAHGSTLSAARCRERDCKSVHFVSLMLYRSSCLFLFGYPINLTKYLHALVHLQA